MARMRERLGGRLRPPSRLDGRRIRRLTGGDEADIDDPVVAPKRGRYQLDMVNRASLVHPPRLKSGSLLTANSKRQGKALVG
jgi:hypothetical protein